MRTHISRIVSILSATVLLMACGDIETKDVNGYGIPRVQIQMNTENIGLLLGQTLSKRPVAGELKLEGNIKLKCDVSFAGQSSLNDYRKSYNFRACKGHPDSQTRFRLAAQNRDPTTLRGIMGYEVLKTLGLDVPTTDIMAAYLNQDYLGVYLLAEPISTEFYSRRGRSVSHIYQAKFGNSGFKKEYASDLSGAFDYEGDGKDNFVSLSGLYSTLWEERTEEDFVRRIDQQLDVDAFLSYAAGAFYIAHWDGFDNNYFLAYDRNQQKLVMTPWDLDRVWEKSDTLEPTELLRVNRLLAKMLTVPVYQKLFLEKLDTLRGQFPLEALLAAAEAHYAKIEPALAQDPINGPDRVASFETFKKMISLWHQKVEAYRDSVVPL